MGLSKNKAAPGSQKNQQGGRPGANAEISRAGVLCSIHLYCTDLQSKHSSELKIIPLKGGGKIRLDPKIMSTEEAVNMNLGQTTRAEH